ncbi:hypothetical protein [Actinoplanes solisilvae]|uniref:hypothetical protein n=1 Tax=Actinoplanes solisilvae TaxID=2486853 RepID=UPI000FD8F849|nr:hypothetical protein [Actinoplanes solisilvae]
MVPPELVPGLKIPELAITDGSTEVEWVPVSLSGWATRREPSMLLPLDRRSARSMRRYRRFVPVLVLVLLLQLAAWVLRLADLLPNARLVTGGLLVAVFGLILWLKAGMPAKTPRRTRSGEVRIPAVPEAVAQQWIALNPGVRPRS